MQQKLIQYNDYFIQNMGQGDINCDAVFSYFEQGSYVCLSAPHATQTFANKHVKKSDLFTGAIIRYLAQENDFSYIVRNKFVPRKVLINDFILERGLENHFFLDFHGMKDGNGFDLAVGTGYLPAQNYLSQLKCVDLLCCKYGIKYVINHENYTGCAGLVGRLQKTTGQANVLQLEWSKVYRDFFMHPENVINVTIPFMRELARYIDLEKKL
jgi:hypothetical protein